MLIIGKNYYPKYTWVGNRINKEDMAMLYQLKKITRKPITKMVAEAVAEYLIKHNITGLSMDL